MQSRGHTTFAEMIDSRNLNHIGNQLARETGGAEMLHGPVPVVVVELTVLLHQLLLFEALYISY